MGVMDSMPKYRIKCINFMCTLSALWIGGVIAQQGSAKRTGEIPYRNSEEHTVFINQNSNFYSLYITWYTPLKSRNRKKTAWAVYHKH